MVDGCFFLPKQKCELMAALFLITSVNIVSLFVFKYFDVAQFTDISPKNILTCMGPLKGRVTLPNLMNFRKNSKRPLTPPPHFWKIILQIFIMNMVAFMQGGIGHIVSVNINTIVEKHRKNCECCPGPYLFTSVY